LRKTGTSKGFSQKRWGGSKNRTKKKEGTNPKKRGKTQIYAKKPPRRQSKGGKRPNRGREPTGVKGRKLLAAWFSKEGDNVGGRQQRVGSRPKERRWRRG